MRVLFTTNPMPAHVRPTAPLVAELVRQGHEVAWYTSRAFESLVRSTGATMLPAGVEPDMAAALHAGSGRRGLAKLNAIVLEAFLRPLPAYLADLEAPFDAFRPDVLVADHSFRAGLFLAERRGVPSVAFSVGPLNLSGVDVAPFGTGLAPARTALGRARNRVLHRFVRSVRSRELQRVAAEARRGAGLAALDGFFIDWASMVADRYLEATVPEFEYPRRDLRPNVEFVGAMLEAGVDDWQPPGWWPDLAAARRAGRPVVFLTQGSITTDPAHLLLPTLAALADEDVLVLATTSGRAPEELPGGAPPPANARLVEFVPYVPALAEADVMVSNGGYGGVQTALAHGVPVVVAGRTEDKREITARVAWSGAGLSLRTDAPSQRQVRDAVRRVLHDPSFRRRATALRDAHARYAATERATAAVVAVAEAAAQRRGHRRENEEASS